VFVDVAKRFAGLETQQRSLILHGPGGVLSQIDSPEAQCVLGGEETPDVLAVLGEGIALRHAGARIAEEQMEVEDLGGGRLVNGHPIGGASPSCRGGTSIRFARRVRSPRGSPRCDYDGQHVRDFGWEEGLGFYKTLGATS